MLLSLNEVVAVGVLMVVLGGVPDGGCGSGADAVVFVISGVGVCCTFNVGFKGSISVGEEWVVEVVVMFCVFVTDGVVWIGGTIA